VGGGGWGGGGGGKQNNTLSSKIRFLLFNRKMLISFFKVSFHRCDYISLGLQTSKPSPKAGSGLSADLFGPIAV